MHLSVALMCGLTTLVAAVATASAQECTPVADSDTVEKYYGKVPAATPDACCAACTADEK